MLEISYFTHVRNGANPRLRGGGADFGGRFEHCNKHKQTAKQWIDLLGICTGANISNQVVQLRHSIYALYITKVIFITAHSEDATGNTSSKWLSVVPLLYTGTGSGT